MVNVPVSKYPVTAIFCRKIGPVQKLNPLEFSSECILCSLGFRQEVDGITHSCTRIFPFSISDI